LDREPDKEEKDEFEETDKDFVVEVVTMDFTVCTETFEDEPAEIFVDTVGEDDVEDLADCGDDRDYDENGVEIVGLWELVEEIGDFKNLFPQS
jgi:hypothetical protein